MVIAKTRHIRVLTVSHLDKHLSRRRFDGKAVDFDLDVSVNLFGIEFKVCADSLTDSAVDFLVEKKVEQDSERDCFCPETGRDFS